MILKDIAVAFDTILSSMTQNFHFVGGILFVLWAVHFINWLLGYRLSLLGIYPRSAHGLLGIIFSPFLHGNIGHLVFNSIPLFFLANLVLLQG